MTKVLRIFALPFAIPICFFAAILDPAPSLWFVFKDILDDWWHDFGRDSK